MIKSNIFKKGFRVLGIAESFKKGMSSRSLLTGVVMRADFVIDGINFTFSKVGGLDSTERIIELYTEFNRTDIGAILINGCIISWFNIVDLEKLFQVIQKPIICLTYEESQGIEKYLREYFPNDWALRLEIYNRNGDREKIYLKTRHFVFVQVKGITVRRALVLLNKFTIHGAIPEPIRIAKLISNAAIRKFKV
ncbi:MAG: DUF99 family protein [Candidatus Asgardarchaeia archaeon]